MVHEAAPALCAAAHPEKTRRAASALLVWGRDGQQGSSPWAKYIKGGSVGGSVIRVSVSDLVSAQVIISRVMESSPVLGSMLSGEPA